MQREGNGMEAGEKGGAGNPAPPVLYVVWQFVQLPQLPLGQ
jgi:hypothetical protein